MEPLHDLPVVDATRVTAWTSVLVPLDGYDISTWALARARRIVEQPGISVTLLRVVECDEDRANDLHFRLDPRHAPAQLALAETRAALLNPSAPVSMLLRFGDPVKEILREIDEQGHDLVIMSSQGRTRFGLGSVAERTLQDAPVPLLLFRPVIGRDAAFAYAPVPKRDPAEFKRLLVMLDGLDAAEEILPMAESVARAFGSELHLFGAVFAGSREAAQRYRAEEYFRNRAAAFRTRGIQAHVHISTGSPASEALALIRDLSLDSVALMTHGRSGLARAVHGSVAQTLIRESGVPVLVLRNRRLRGPLAPATQEHRQLWVD